MGQMSTPILTAQTLVSSNKKGSHVRAKIGGFESMVLVDSGADRSIMPKHLWETITKGCDNFMKYTGSVSAANGGGMKIIGVW